MHRELALFFSNGIGLCNWEERGFLDREVALYRELQQNGWKITFFTYDRSRKIPAINAIRTICQWPFVLPRRLNWIYEMAMPLLRFRQGQNSSVIMTNQAYRGWPAIIAGKIWRSKVVARCGMVYGEQIERSMVSGFVVTLRKYSERITFKYSDACIVPTQHLSDWIQHNYGIKKSKIHIIPNFVDLDTFHPRLTRDDNNTTMYDVVVVGRLDKIKRHILILEAARGCGWKLLFIGQGYLADELRNYAASNGINLVWIPSVPNRDLPSYLLNSKVFMLLSEFEGHPKALIEAMACGCACIGADSPGINNILEHGKNGLLVKPEVSAVTKAVVSLLNNDQFRQQLGDEARQHAQRYYSLKDIVGTYAAVFDDLIIS